MRVELGAKVQTSDGKDVGAVDQLIVDPGSKEVKSVVVRKGVLLPRDVEIPLDVLESADGRDVRLSYTSAQVDRLPEFHESSYTVTPPVGFMPPAGYPVTGMLWPQNYQWAMPSAAAATYEADHEAGAELRQQDLENAVIAEGSSVIDRDGKEVGSAHDLTFDPASGRLAHLVIREGLIFSKNVSVPASLISRVADGVIYLKVKAAEIAA